MEKITEYLIKPTLSEKGIVKVWKETIKLPTYEIGEEEKNPIFLEKRVYQGSSGVVYPYPVVEKICDEKKEKDYQAYFLENEYLKIMILPELGGRVQMAYDKVKKRHFVYYNQVIKPALVGLTGPWISGGIEFNWPQHHRPSTYLPTDCMIEENADGSKTVWCNEVERMFNTKGMQGFTLHPDKAYLEINVKVYNRTPFPQTFLWWANPAVVVNDHYHSVFPPDVHAVFDHGKRDVSNFPIATGIYYKQDYSEGVDISKYKNIPVPTSYMAIKSRYDFVGGYEEHVQAGLLHVADHHLSPGKKQWTWGNGDFGIAWDRNLTDEDGPYIELMTGVYTDNQPDFTWLQPYEEKSWKQYFLPYSEVGYVKNATKDFILNLDVAENTAHIIVYATGRQENIKVELRDITGKILFDKVTILSPENIFKSQVNIAEQLPENLILSLYDNNGKLLLEYKADKPEIKPTPDPAKAAKQPKEIASIEQLFLTGLHLEQYRHATYDPMAYYMEALEREPGDIRCNNAVGLLNMRRGKFEEAEQYFHTAIKTLTERNPNPYDGEPYYNLGWSLKMQGKYDEAYSAYYKATWNAAWRDAGYFGVAQIDSIRKDWNAALEHVDLALIHNWHNHKARQLKASILRHSGETEKALKFIEESLTIDKFNLGCRFEKYFIGNNLTELQEMTSMLNGSVHNYIEYAFDFASAGMYEEASQIMHIYMEGRTDVYPMAAYMLGYFASRSGNEEVARQWYQKAQSLSPDKCFPNRIDEINVLTDAMRMNPADYKAPYYLGNFWYAHRRYEEAISCWEKSVEINNQFPTALRNLSLAYYNKRNKKEEARQLLEKAFELDKTDSRIFMELDQLYKKMGRAHAERLALLEEHLDLVEQRDDLCIERITLYNLLGDYEKAKDLISNRKFHPWEGGEGKVTGQYILCRVELAKKAIKENRYSEAVALLKETEFYPHNLGEGKLSNAEENEVDYYKGIAYQKLGNDAESTKYLMKATQGSTEPQQAFYYNDQQPDKIFYQGLAWRALGEENKARSRFNKLIDHGKKHRKRKRSRQGCYLLAHKPEVLEELVAQIASGTFRVKDYREREIIEGGKLRRIQVIPMKDRIAVHAIMAVVDRHLRKRFIRTTSASIKRRGMHDLLAYVRRDMAEDPDGTRYCYKFDITKFYESVKQDFVMYCVSRVFKDAKLVTMLESFIRLMPEGLSIGLRSSQGLGNLLLSVYLDHYLKDRYAVRHFYRYCDDGVVLGKTKAELWKIRDAVHGRMECAGLLVKGNERVFPPGEGIDFLGYVTFGADHVRLRKRIKQKFARKMHEVKSRRRRRELIASFYGMAKHADCHTLFKKLTGKDMRSFKDLNVSYKPEDGKKRFPGVVVSIRELVNLPIVVKDFETGIKTEQGEDRCIVAIEMNGEPKKFFTNSEEMKNILLQVKDMPDGFPFETTIKTETFGKGRTKYIFT